MQKVTVALANAETPPHVYYACARLHMAGVPYGGLTLMGERFLASMYRHIATHEASFLILATSEGDLQGFICGSEGSGNLLRTFCLGAGMWSTLRAVPRLIGSFGLKRVRETVQHMARADNSQLPPSEILNFVIDNGQRGTGLAKQMFEALCDEFRRRGVNSIAIVTGSEQMAAQRFYEKCGATSAGRVEIHKGVPSTSYIFRL